MTPQQQTRAKAPLTGEREEDLQIQSARRIARAEYCADQEAQHTKKAEYHAMRARGWRIEGMEARWIAGGFARELVDMRAREMANLRETNARLVDMYWRRKAKA